MTGHDFEDSFGVLGAHEIEQRHAGVQDLMRWFDARHLQDLTARGISAGVGDLALNTLHEIYRDSPELTAGLRKLLEAKDCFVRAAIAQRELEVAAGRTPGGEELEATA